MTAEEQEFATWVKDVYAPAVDVIAGAFQEAAGATPENARHFATAVLARLMHQDPTITVSAFRESFLEPS